jgi:serine/threonine protein phosphatase PrpC
MITDTPFVEVDFAQQSKHGQGSPGDVFISNRSFEDGRIVCVLADGLGSGIKANVLATLTSTMAMKYVSSDMDIKKAAAVIMSTLPICSQRKIGYSTFTIVDIRSDGNVSVVEYDNPSYVLLNGRNHQSVEKNDILIDAPNIGQRVLHFSRFKAEEGNKLVLYTDGVTQSGMGSQKMPLGWTQECAQDFVTKKVNAFEGISARHLSRDVVTKALGNDRFSAKDDISCAVVNFRRPRKMLVLTGPPINKDRDRDMALILKEFQGKKVICGGTTANIAARELGLEVEVELSGFDP